MKVNQKGQEFEVFNLLIGAVLALAILVIIVSIINYFEGIKVDSSRQAIEQKVKNAAQSPDGSVFVVREVVVPEHQSFSSKYFAEEVLNLNEECIEFDYPFELTSMRYPDPYSTYKNRIEFTKRVQLDFYVVCQPREQGKLLFHDYATMQCPVSCEEFCCLLSFGVNPALANS